MSKLNDNSLLYERNISRELISSLKSLCDVENQPESQISNFSKGTNDLRIYVLKLSLKDAIVSYEIERVSSLLKIMSKKVRMIKSIKGLSFQLKNFIQCMINIEEYQKNSVTDGDLVHLYNWLKRNIQ